MEKYLEQVKSYIDAHRDEMIAVWRDVVNLEGSTQEKDNVNLCGDRFKEEFEKAGLTCKKVFVGEGSADSLVGIIGEDRPGKPVIFSGHFDTVFPKGTFGENPFKIEDGKAYGPGCLDMKGGIVIALYVIKALNSIGYSERPLKIIFSGDEETGHRGSKGADVFLEEGKGGICAFNLETGLVDNSLCVGRKTAVRFYITVNGVESHAGNDFTSGRNAIWAAAAKIIEIQQLTDLSQGTTVNCGVIKGGTVPNAVPAKCEIAVDARFESSSEVERVKKAIAEIVEKTHVEGTSATHYWESNLPLFEPNDRVMSFCNFAVDIARKYGFEELKYKKLGGGSDAAFITEVKTPVLCSFGVRGEHNHTDREYAIVETLFDRAKLIAAIILNLKDYVPVDVD